jgi:hypothetical protein
MQDFIQNKNVIIVGPSPCIIRKNYGPKIDSYDVVIRTNGGFPVQEEYQKDYGSKCDILYTNVFFSRKILKEIEEFGFSKRIQEYEKLGLKFLCTKPNIQINTNFKVCQWKNPTSSNLTGTRIIEDMILFGAESITITGMDFYQNKKTPYIEGYLPENFNFNYTQGDSYHKYEKQRLYIEKLVRQNKIVWLK